MRNSDKVYAIVKDKVIKTVYLAGKVSNANWRNEIFTNHDDDRFGWSGTKSGFSFSARYDENDNWQINDHKIRVSYNTVLKYVGPYWVSFDCCGGHCRCESCCEPHAHHKVLDKCLWSLDQTDLVFCWIDQQNLFGTFAEIAYANAKKKHIVIAVKTGLDTSDIWFPLGMADQSFTVDSAGEAWHSYWNDPGIVGKMAPSPRVTQKDSWREMYWEEEERRNSDPAEDIHEYLESLKFVEDGI